MRLRKAFTLIELLVVVAIISLLVSILLPSLQQAREAARSVVCMSELRRLGQCALFYVDDFDEYQPPMAAWVATPGGVQWWAWFDHLYTYVGRDFGPDNRPVDAQGIWVVDWECPTLGNPYDHSYSINLIAGTFESDPDTKEIVNVYVKYGEGYTKDYSAPFQVTSSLSEVGWFLDRDQAGDIYWRRSWTNWMTGIDFRHSGQGGTCNVAFYDGHVDKKANIPPDDYFWTHPDWKDVFGMPD